MENIGWYVNVFFILTVLLSIWLFSKATLYSKSAIILILIWSIVQSILALTGFYIHSITARFPLLVLPPMLFLISLFFRKNGRLFLHKLDIKTLTIFHSIRIFVEITLLFLFLSKSIPKAMTFEGRNLDIISGLTAPIIYYLVFVKRLVGRVGLIIWNCICVLLLLNVVSAAVLSLPERFQQFGFERPNIAVAYFPFNLLPSLLVPLALFSNVAAIRQLILNKNLIVKSNLQN